MRLSVAAVRTIILSGGCLTGAQAQIANQGALGAAYLSEGSITEDFLRQETVTTRAHPETDPLGIHAGSFLILPALVTSESFNDNIYATTTGALSDFVTTLAPSVAVRSDWNNGQIGFNASNSDNFYASHTSENTTDYSFTGNGRLDIDRQQYISIRGGFSKLHEDRTSPNNDFGALPTVYSLGDAEFEYFNKINRVSLTADGLFNKFSYTNTPATTGFINEVDRDRSEYTGTGRIGYEFKPLMEAYVKGSYSDRAYDTKFSSDGYARSSRGYSATTGIALDLGGITFGEIGVGYMSRSYDDSRFGTVSGPTANASITWNASPITTVKLIGQRTIEETITFASSGFVANLVTASVDHELLRNLLLNAAVTYSYNDYQDNPRKDTVYGGTVGATYLLNHDVTLNAKYSYRDQTSTAALVAYRQNLALVSIGLRL
jgi:hypothetical protein